MTAGSLVAPLAAAYDVALLDLDGVVYVGEFAVPSAPPALESLRALGLRLAYVTNNAARTPTSIAAHLTELGVPASAEDVVTSAQAAARELADRLPAGSAVLVLGAAGLIEAVEHVGLRAVFSAEDRPAAVVQGYSPELGWRQLTEGALAMAAGIPWILTNGDLTIPTPRGLAPGAGALASVLVTATGRQPDVVAGKPYPPLMHESVRRTGAERPLVIGDRLDTDIEGANAAGLDSALVLTGVATALDAAMAPPPQRPTHLVQDLAGLLQPMPTVAFRDGGHRCGDWLARIVESRLEITGSGDTVDAWRAGCAAAWSTDDRLDLSAVAGLRLR